MEAILSLSSLDPSLASAPPTGLICDDPCVRYDHPYADLRVDHQVVKGATGLGREPCNLCDSLTCSWASSPYLIPTEAPAFQPSWNDVNGRSAWPFSRCS